MRCQWQEPSPSQTSPSDPEFVLRITSTLVAFKISAEPSEDLLSDTLRLLDHECRSSYHQACPSRCIFRDLNSIDKYYLEYGFKSPEDNKNCSITIGFSKRDMDGFKTIESLPGHIEGFTEAMTLTGCFGWPQ